IPQSGFKLNANGLTSAGPAQLGGQTYALYSAANVPRDTMLAGQLGGLGGSSLLGNNQLALISLGVVLFVLGGGVLLCGGRARASIVPPSPEAIERERLELVVKMAALDDRYASGEVSERDYTAERQRGKQRLRELTLQQRTLSTG